ncbi:MAG: hypothetical protein R6U63_04265 [Longimicrobiales bacterium]
MADRLDEARRVLDEAGIDAPVRAAGTDGEIAAVMGSSDLREPLARVAPELQALGFRYVALELENQRSTPERDS